MGMAEREGVRKSRLPDPWDAEHRVRGGEAAERDDPAEPDARGIRGEVARRHDHARLRRSSSCVSTGFPCCVSSISRARNRRGVALEEVANDLAHASTLQCRTLHRAPVEVLRDPNRDARRLRSNCRAERRATRTRLPGGQFEPVLEPLGQTVDVGSPQSSAGSRLHCPWHRITLS
jgi:hypothetical protein